MSVSESIDLSIIVPLYNEEENVELLHRSTVKALESLPLGYEIIFVDDGSTDQTFTRAKALAMRDSRLKVIRFRCNRGQTPAMSAGIDLARGRILVTMDGDLQNDPTDIPGMIKLIDSGYDLVVGWRHKRQDNLITRRLPSLTANWIIGKVIGVPIKDIGCSLKAYRASVVQSIPLYSEMHRFIPAMMSIAGARIKQVKVKHHARRFGDSKYGLSRVYKVLLDLLVIKTIVSFGYRPMLWFSILSIPCILISIVALSFSFFDVMVEDAEFSLPLAGTGLLFGMLTLFILFTGALGELIFRTENVSPDRLALITAKHVQPLEPTSKG